MQRKVRKKILVNLITSLRLIGTFMMIPIYLCFGWLTTAVIAGILFATDFIDGTLARKFHVETFFGSILDTVADKSFAILILGILAFLNPLFIISIIFELIIFIVNYTSIQKGNNVQSSVMGKIKTFLLDFTLVITLLLIALDNIEKINLSLSFLIFLTIPSLIAQIITIVDYIKKAYKAKYKDNKIKNDKVFKSSKEIIGILFNTEYYHEHKGDRLKNLLYK